MALESRQYVEIAAPEGLEAFVDADQLEQALINLAKNAVEACECGPIFATMPPPSKFVT